MRNTYFKNKREQRECCKAKIISVNCVAFAYKLTDRKVSAPIRTKSKISFGKEKITCFKRFF